MTAKVTTMRRRAATLFGAVTGILAVVVDNYLANSAKPGLFSLRPEIGTRYALGDNVCAHRTRVRLRRLGEATQRILLSPE